MNLEIEKRAAVLSADRKYRWTLTRRWDHGSEDLLWIMLNPSTADALVDDPTVRRCIGFSQREGYGSLTVVNLYALRSSKPSAITEAARADQWVRNATVLRDEIGRHRVAIAAWGAGWEKLGLSRPRVELYAQDAGTHLLCLGTTKGGHPRHPLYVRADAPLSIYRDER